MNKDNSAWFDSDDVIVAVVVSVEPDRVISFRSFDGVKKTKAEVGSRTAIRPTVSVVPV